MRQVWLMWVIVFVTVLCLIVDLVNCAPEYYYKRYPYRKKSKTEKKIKSLKQQCETGEECHGVYGLDLTNCARRCMSPECYSELYGDDELEEGEIDVRFNSFKGCVLEKLPRF